MTFATTLIILPRQLPPLNSLRWLLLLQSCTTAVDQCVPMVLIGNITALWIAKNDVWCHTHHFPVCLTEESFALMVGPDQLNLNCTMNQCIWIDCTATTFSNFLALICFHFRVSQLFNMWFLDCSHPCDHQLTRTISVLHGELQHWFPTVLHELTSAVHHKHFAILNIWKR